MTYEFYPANNFFYLFSGEYKRSISSPSQFIIYDEIAENNTW